MLARQTPLGSNRAMSSDYDITVHVSPRYLPEQSAPQQNRYAFAYTVRITNVGKKAAQLQSRHWVITDANGKIEEVRGQGVVGEQPNLAPGSSFEYTSGAVISTSVGSMRGSYQMLSYDGHHFDAQIQAFTLSIPRTLH
jgi:ApaG protein